MDLDPYETLRVQHQESSADETSEVGPDPSPDLISRWLFDAIESGCSEVLQDLQFHDQERYIAAREILSTRLATETPMDKNDLSRMKFSDRFITSSTALATTEQIIAAAASNDLSLLRRLTSEAPESINFQDEAGNTALIYAARCGRYEALDFLLDQPDCDASICNWGQQAVLHFLDIFTDQQIERLVPRLINSKAVIDQQAALPVITSWGEAPELKPRIRSCPILQAILCNNLVLLRSLLTAAHSLPTKCRICETGSRYRRMISIAVALHRAEVLEVLQEHLNVRNAGGGTKLHTIEVWYNHELLPVWQLAVRGLPASVADLPESFSRALNYGRKGIDTLHKTLELLRHSETSFLPTAYHQLQQAAAAGNTDAVDFLTKEAERWDKLPQRWWLLGNDFHENPLIMSIRLGYRDAFKRLWSLDVNLFNNGVTSSCLVFQCRTCRSPEDYLGKKQHLVNMAQVGLSIAATAAHQDDFFM
jgi:hypothetical protein